MRKFEYQIYDQTDGVNPDSRYELDELGEQGWELVAIRPSDRSVGGYKFYFKREICIDCTNLVQSNFS